MGVACRGQANVMATGHPALATGTGKVAVAIQAMQDANANRACVQTSGNASARADGNSVVATVAGVDATATAGIQVAKIASGAGSKTATSPDTPDALELNGPTGLQPLAAIVGAKPSSMRASAWWIG